LAEQDGAAAHAEADAWEKAAGDLEIRQHFEAMLCTVELLDDVCGMDQVTTPVLTHTFYLPRFPVKLATFLFPT
jgi:hypothetical protein